MHTSGNRAGFDGEYFFISIFHIRYPKLLYETFPGVSILRGKVIAPVTIVQAGSTREQELFCRACICLRYAIVLKLSDIQNIYKGAATYRLII